MDLSTAKGALEAMKEPMRVLLSEARKHPELSNGHRFGLYAGSLAQDYRELLQQVCEEQKFQESQSCATS